MKRIRWQVLVIILSFVVLLVAQAGYAQAISSAELILNAKRYDNKIVVFQGEAIGEVMTRGDGSWINLNDGANAIGVWMPTSLSKQITTTGNYRNVGDTVEVSGIFHNACPDHGGDLDIHAQSMRIVLQGRKIDKPVNVSKRNFAIFLLGVLALIWILITLKKK